MTEPSRDRAARLLAALDALAGPFEPSRPPVELVRAPGRVNLIGEHTDYNDGFVLPAAIDLDTWIAFRRRTDDLVRVESLQAGRAEFRIAGLAPDPLELGGRGWVDYVAGTAWSLRETPLRVHGIDGVVDSTVPLGSGLSSSAALELATAWAVLDGADVPDAASLASIAQRAEHDFVGVNCGIMDQLASAAGHAGRAMLLDCRSLEVRYVELPPGVSVVVCDTRSPRTLAGSAYNERRAECGRAVALLAERAVPGLGSLRDLDWPTLNRYRSNLPEIVARRAEHVVLENERVISTAIAFEAGDLDEIGRLFAASHESLRDLYEVSSPALDVMVEVTDGVRGVIGSRMTGAGFGGCTVSLVLDEAVPELVTAVNREYARRTGFEPRVYPVRLVDGAGPLPLETAAARRPNARS